MIDKTAGIVFALSPNLWHLARFVQTRAQAAPLMIILPFESAQGSGEREGGTGDYRRVGDNRDFAKKVKTSPFVVSCFCFWARSLPPSDPAMSRLLGDVQVCRGPITISRRS